MPSLNRNVSAKNVLRQVQHITAHFKDNSHNTVTCADSGNKNQQLKIIQINKKIKKTAISLKLAIQN